MNLLITSAGLGMIIRDKKGCFSTLILSLARTMGTASSGLRRPLKFRGVKLLVSAGGDWAFPVIHSFS